MGFMDEVKKQLETMRAKAQSSSLGQTLNKRIVSTGPNGAKFINTMNTLASATPKNIVSGGIKQQSRVFNTPVQTPKVYQQYQQKVLNPLVKLPTSQYVLGRGQTTADRAIGAVQATKQAFNPSLSTGQRYLSGAQALLSGTGAVLGSTPAGMKVDALLTAPLSLAKSASQAISGQPITFKKNVMDNLTGQESLGTTVNPLTRKVFGEQGGDVASMAIDVASMVLGVYKGGKFDPQSRYLKVVNSIPENFNAPLKNLTKVERNLGYKQTSPDYSQPWTSLRKNINDNNVPVISRMFSESIKEGKVSKVNLLDVNDLAKRFISPKDLKGMTPEMKIAELYKHAVGPKIQNFDSTIKTPKLSVEPSSDLLTEARKYKSSEEFVKAAKDGKIKVDVLGNGNGVSSEQVRQLYKGVEQTPEAVTKRLTDFYNQAQPSSVEGGVQIKQSGSSGNIYLKTGKGQVVTGIPKTVQSDLNQIANGEVVNPDRMYKTSEFLRKKGYDLVRNEDTFEYDIVPSQVGGKVGGESTQVTPKLSQQELPVTNIKTTNPEPVISKPQSMAGGQSNLQQTSPSDSIILSPVQKITQALTEAKPIRGQQEAIYAKARSQQAARLAGVGKNVSGEKGYFAQLGQLKGQLPKAQFEGVRNKIQQSDIDELFNMVEQKNIFSPFEKVNAKTALSKLLGAEGGQVPTRSELKLLSEVFPPEMITAIQSNRTRMEKLMGVAGEVLNIPRAMMATADLSAPLRQGVFLVGRPKQWMPAFKEMFKYAFSEKAYEGLAKEIESRPTYKAMRQNKLAITDTGPNMSSREEAFMTSLPEKIPVFGSIAKGSNRAYSGFLTKLRADVFDDMYKSASEQGLLKDNPKVAEDIAKFVNAATGRGTLGAFEKATEVLTQVAFAPRLVASRVQLLNPVYYAKLDPFVRKEALKSLLSFVGTGATVLGLAKMGGAEVGTEPTSSDFGKIKVGNTRYDIWGGFQQYVKLASQLAAEKITNSESGKVMTLGEGYKPMTRKDILIRFFEGKESPVASFISGLLTKVTPTGEPMNIPAETISRFIPLIVQDIYDLYNENGSKGILMGTPGAFGVGSQTYGKKELVSGVNKVGQPTQQIRPVKDLPTKISDKIFGEKPLGTTSSWNAEVWLDQFKKMSPEEKKSSWLELSKNPDLKKKVEDVGKARAKGITIQDEQLKLKGVASGDRAITIAKTLNKAKTKEERNKLYAEYVRKGIITKDVAKQIPGLLKKYE